MFRITSADFEEPAVVIAFLDLAEQAGRYEKRYNLLRLCAREGDSVIDVGCGTGRQSVELARLVGTTGKVIGIDKSSSLLREARERHRRDNLTYRLADVYALPFDDESFDKAHIQRVLHCLDQPSHAMKEVVRVLRCGTGRAMFNEPDWSSLRIDGGDEETSRNILRVLDCDPETPMNFGQRLDRHVDAAGLVVEHRETRHFKLAKLELSIKLFDLFGLAGRAVREGYVGQDALVPWFRSLAQAASANSFICSLSGQTVVGRRA